MEDFRGFVEDPKFQRRGPLKVTAMLHDSARRYIYVTLENGESISARVTWVEDLDETKLKKIHAERPNLESTAMVDMIEVYHYTDVGTPDVAYIRPAPKP